MSESTTKMAHAADGPSGDVVQQLRGLMVAHRGQAMTVMQVRQHKGLIQGLLRDVLEDGVHYGVPESMPRETKPFLYDSGAQTIRMLFNLRAEYEVVQALEREDFIGYTVRARLYDRESGVLVGEALGACNSRERKYRWRTVPEFKAQKGDEERAVKVEQRQSERGPYRIFTIENDPWDFQQTLLSMAQVRASKKATRDALAASDVLGLDTELAEQMIADAEVVSVTGGQVQRRGEAMREHVQREAEDAANRRNAGKPRPEASRSAPAAPSGQDPSPRDALLGEVAKAAASWSSATNAAREDFKLLVQEVCAYQTSDYRQLTEEQLASLLQTLREETKKATTN